MLSIPADDPLQFFRAYSNSLNENILFKEFEFSLSLVLLLEFRVIRSSYWLVSLFFDVLANCSASISTIVDWFVIIIPSSFSSDVMFVGFFRPFIDLILSQTIFDGVLSLSDDVNSWNDFCFDVSMMYLLFDLALR